jgi:hypothetical protein
MRNLFLVLVIVLLLLPVTLAAQQRPGPRTPWGDPDLQGVYTFATPTPLERPDAMANKGTLTEAEIEALEEQVAAGFGDEDQSCIGGRCRPLEEGNVGHYNNFWLATERGRLTGRTSLIVEPENGRKPEFTERAKTIRERLVQEAASRRVGTPPYVHTIYNSWADHPAYTRCLARPMPRLGQSYNHGIQILQTPGQVVIFYESMHDVRVIPLDGRPHIDSKIRQWNGDSRGRWEGNTLVIESRNYTDKMEWQGAPEGNMRFTERLTKIDDKTVSYELTVDDPTTWTQPWTVVLPWRADDPNYQEPEDLYEYACHEGNYRMMEDSLSGSRVLKQGRQ